MSNADVFIEDNVLDKSSIYLRGWADRLLYNIKIKYNIFRGSSNAAIYIGHDNGPDAAKLYIEGNEILNCEGGLYLSKLERAGSSFYGIAEDETLSQDVEEYRKNNDWHPPNPNGNLDSHSCSRLKAYVLSVSASIQLM